MTTSSGEGERADVFYALRDGWWRWRSSFPRVSRSRSRRFTAATCSAGRGSFPPYRWSFDARVVEDTSAISLRRVLPARKVRRRSRPRLRADAAVLGGDGRATPGDPTTPARRLWPQWLRRRRCPTRRRWCPTAFGWSTSFRRPRTRGRSRSSHSTDEGPLEFDAGQFNMVYAFGAGEVPISISGDPNRPERLIHTVRAVGATSEAICAASPGEVLGIRGPFGSSWPLGQAQGKDMVVIAGGIGLAPLRPVVYELLSRTDHYETGAPALRRARAGAAALPGRARGVASRDPARGRGDRRHRQRPAGTGAWASCRR